MVRSSAHVRPVALLLVLLLELAVLDAGSLPAAVAVCALIGSRSASAVPRTRVRTAIRDRERRTAFLPQRDPDASGRPRPRAPGRALLTAAA
ncbi:DUF6412 domain-containing protein [Streptomyces mirabilis]|uniref:DUF6412 domain-containing protein n=1 Tax=Streptomyces mirabilis TaxID=68239 RepID=UPI0033278579